MSLAYAKEKLYIATLTLATGEGPIATRLEGAALSLIRLQREDFPGDTFAEYSQIMDALTARDAEFKDEGKIQSTLRQIDTHAATKLAERIYNLHFKVLGVPPL